MYIVEKTRIANEPDAVDDDSAAREKVSGRLTRAEIEEELAKRVAMMREGASADAETDQYRVYQYIIGELESGNYLRLMVQASARRLFAI